MCAAAASPTSEWDTERESPLLLECVRGSHEAWKLLHIRYYPVTVAFLRKLGVPGPDVEDASQDVFLQMYRYLPRFRGTSELKTWLYRLCLTQARALRRRQRVSQALRSLFSLTPDSMHLSSPGFCEESASRRVQAALESLSEDERAALVLYDLERLPGKQVAEILGCKEGTLWRRLHYARKKFIEALEASAAMKGLT
jgi:RNA polymerase sigma-70 factor (ECF subfamily)